MTKALKLIKARWRLRAAGLGFQGLAAFFMPPIIKDASWNFEDLRLQELKPRSLRSVSEVPQWSTRSRLSVNELRASGVTWKFGEQGKRLSLWERGSSKRASSNELWAVPLAEEGLWWSAPSSATWVALSFSLNKIYILNSRRTELRSWSFPKESEVMAFEHCDYRHQLLVENVLSHGVTRVYMFKDGAPLSYTVFDFSGTQRKSDVSDIKINNCFDFEVSGSFGTKRVQY